jgi:hypothetical protein
VISEGNIRMLAKAAGELLAHEQAKDAPAVDTKGKVKGAKKAAAEAEVPVATNGAAKVYVAPDLDGIVEGVNEFAAIALRLSGDASKDGERASHPSRDEAATWMGHPASSPELAGEVVRLPGVVLRFPEGLQKAARAVLPSQDVHVPAAQVWAPVLGWMAVCALPSPAAALALFDALRLRHALAETCSAVGVKGEDAWRVAAGIRVLLRVAQEPTLRAAIETESFWQDADVRWLTGTHGDELGVEYFEQERLESFVCWLQLPGLLAGAEDVPGAAREASYATTAATAMAAELANAAKVAGYKVKEFVEGMAARERTMVKVVKEPVVKEMAAKKSVKVDKVKS